MRRIRTTQTSTTPAPVLGVYTWSYTQDSFIYGCTYWTARRPRWTWRDNYGSPITAGAVGTDVAAQAVVLLRNGQVGIIQNGQIDAALADLGLRVAP